jgi:peptide/nickel transport system permease protein
MGALVLLIVISGAIFAAQIAPHEPNKQRLIARFKPPFWMTGGSMQYPLGRDNVGATSGAVLFTAAAFPWWWAALQCA